jgi:hypothetical protein
MTMLEIAYQKRVAGSITLVNTTTNTGFVTPTAGDHGIEFRSADLIGISFGAPAVGTAVFFNIYTLGVSLVARSIRAA